MSTKCPSTAAATAMAGDVYRVSLARSDLKVTLDGVQIKSALALGSWLAFMNSGQGGTVIGESCCRKR